jgi:hypothetical protein
MTPIDAAALLSSSMRQKSHEMAASLFSCLCDISIGPILISI